MSLVTKPVITLKSANGKYVCAEEEGVRRIVANKEDDTDASSRFTIIGFDISNMPPDSKFSTLDNNGFSLNDLFDNFIALQTKQGNFVTAVPSIGLESKVNKIDVWERFQLIDLGEGKVALKAHNGKYVCAEGGGGQQLIANRDAIGPWETFILSKSYISNSKEHFYQSDSNPAIEYVRIIVDIAFDLSGIPGGSIVGLCFDLLSPTAQSLTVNDVRKIANESVAQDRRRERIKLFSSHQQNWKNAKQNYTAGGRIEDYLIKLIAIEQDLLRDVEETIEFTPPNYGAKRYEYGSSIDTLLYSFDGFGQLSFLHLSVIREIISICGKPGISSLSKDIDKQQYTNILNEKKHQYKEYASAAKSALLDDRLSYISIVEAAHIKASRCEVGEECDVMRFYDHYYNSNKNHPLGEEQYGTWIFDPPSVKRNARARVEATRNRYCQIVASRLSEELQIKAPILAA